MSAPATTRASLFGGLDPATYRPHSIHTGERTYIETNCYTDILVELLHARGDEPLAAMGFLVRMDFEGDQWTFFKPPPEDLEILFGVDVHEMQPYRPLPAQVAEQLSAGRTMTIEVDSWHLPDTAATSYRREHVKTSLIPETIDLEGEVLRYFHNAGFYELSGEDFRGVFQVGALPPYVELIRFDAGPRLQDGELRDAALELLRRHLERRPATNPFERFGEQLSVALPELLEGEAADYHAYAFATVRMAGSAFEISASHLDWLLGEQASATVESFRRIVEGSKMLSLKLARRRDFDTGPAIAALAGAWDEGMAALDARTP
ncbi:MAG: DUF1839 family protein [Gaiellaceae bacterium]